MSVVLATAGYDHKIRFWEAPNGVCIRMIKFPDSQVNRLEITPDKQFIAAAGNPHVRLYEIQNNSGGSGGGMDKSSGSHAGGGSNAHHGVDSHHNSHHSHDAHEAVLTLEGHTANVTSLGFQKDGRYLYTGSEDGTIKVWDLRNPHYCRSFDVGAAVNSVCLRADRDEFISGDQNGHVTFWDLNSAEKGPMHSIKPSSPNSHFEALQQQGNNSTSSSNNNSTSTTPYRYSEGIVPIQAVDVSEDSRILVAVSNHGTVFVWDPSATGLNGTSRPVASATTTGNTTATINDTTSDSAMAHANATDTTDATTDTTATTSKSAGDSTPTSAAPTTTSTVAAEHLPQTQSTSSPSHYTDAYGLRPITKFRAHAEKPGTYCLHAKIAPDCRHLVTTASSGVAKLWDTTTWELTQTLIQQPTHNSNAPRTSTSSSSTTSSNSSKWVWDAAFCADSSYLVTASSDHVARLWNLRTGDVVRQYHGHQSAVTCVALNDSSV